MQSYQIHKSCKAVFYNGVLHIGDKCPLCEVEILTEKDYKLKDENKISDKELHKLELTRKKLTKKEKEKEKEKVKLEREAKKLIRKEKEKQKEAKGELKSLVDQIKIKAVQHPTYSYWTNYYFDNLPEALQLEENPKDKLIMVATGLDSTKGEIGIFRKFLKNDCVEYYSEEGAFSAADKKSCRKFIHGFDKKGNIHDIEIILEKFGSVVNAIVHSSFKKKKK